MNRQFRPPDKSLTMQVADGLQRRRWSLAAMKLV
jgi:hypothetical protein